MTTIVNLLLKFGKLKLKKTKTETNMKIVLLIKHALKRMQERWDMKLGNALIRC